MTRDVLLPQAFRWFKNEHMRGGQTLLIRYPSPASEDHNIENRYEDNYRTPYQYSQHNVRTHTFLNPGSDDIVYFYVEPKNAQPIAQKMVNYGYLKPEEMGDSEKVNKAVGKFKEVNGTDPTETMLMTNQEEGFFPASAIFDEDATPEEKRAAFRGMFSASVNEVSQFKKKKVRSGSIEDIYRPKQINMVGRDLALGIPEYRQYRIDTRIKLEIMYEDAKKIGKEKVFRGSPKKSWQVLDESFDAESRRKVQTAVKDSTASAYTSPNETGRSLSIRRRSGLAFDLEAEKDPNVDYISLPYVSQHIK